jgi:hypothetical protein
MLMEWGITRLPHEWAQEATGIPIASNLIWNCVSYVVCAMRFTCIWDVICLCLWREFYKSPNKTRSKRTVNIKTYGEVEVQLHAFLTSATRRRWAVSYTPLPFYFRVNSPQHSWDRRLGGPQPVARRYTDWAIPAPLLSSFASVMLQCRYFAMPVK